MLVEYLALVVDNFGLRAFGACPTSKPQSIMFQFEQQTQISRKPLNCLEQNLKLLTDLLIYRPTSNSNFILHINCDCNQLLEVSLSAYASVLAYLPVY